MKEQKVRNVKILLASELAKKLNELNDLKMKYREKFWALELSEEETEQIIDKVFEMAKDYADKVVR